MGNYILALDQGTTSSRAIVFDHNGQICSVAQKEFTQHFPQPGWVEHNPNEIWSSEAAVIAEAISAIDINGKDIAAIGITNQRETTVVWDIDTDEPIYNAIVWQDRRTAEYCDKLKAQGLVDRIREKTGLIIDAYFSGTKIKWILDNVPGARERAEKGKLRFGNIDTWLVWRLTRGQVHVTDVTNASRTMLFNIHTLSWDEELCALLDIPMNILPRPVSNSEVYGTVAEGIEGLEELAGVPICGAAGDQQAALFGQGCFTRGQAKNTYGTGCFTLMNVGGAPVRSRAGLVTTVGWSLNGETTYALEGSVFNAGSAIQWLRDELQVISTSHECDILAESVPDSGGIYLVPAFTGLGAPYWDMYARGCVVGITRGTTKAHFARAVLESIAYQVTDLMTAMRQDAGCEISLLRVDGGASVSDLMMQFQADLLRIPVDRPAMVETTAFGAASLAGLAAGVWKDLDELSTLRCSERVFTPERAQYECEELYRGWKRAVGCAQGWVEKK